MLSYHPYRDPFAAEGLFAFPDLDATPSDAWQYFVPSDNISNLVYEPANIKPEPLQDLETDFFRLNTDHVPLPEVEPSEESTDASEVGDLSVVQGGQEEEEGEDVEDLWTLPSIVQRLDRCKLTSWDNFLDPVYSEPRSVYLSELGPPAFDFILALRSRADGTVLPSKVAKSDAFLHALFELGMGMESGLFQYDSSARTFLCTTGGFGLYGISSEMQESVIREFIDIGGQMRMLASTTEDGISTTSWSPTLIALCSGVSAITYALRNFLINARPEVQTLLQLRETFSKPHSVVKGLLRLLDATKQRQVDAQIIPSLVSLGQQLTEEVPWLEDILHEVISRSSAPFLRDLESTIGLAGRSTSTLIWNTCGSDFEASETKLVSLPRILPVELSALVSESSRNLQLLREHQPDHPILRLAQNVCQKSLSWECSWEAIERLQTQARDYERSLREAILMYREDPLLSPGDSPGLETDVVTPTDTAHSQDLLEPLIGLDLNESSNSRLGNEPGTEHSKLHQLVSASFFSGTNDTLTLNPPFTKTLQLSLTPLLNAQFRLLNYSVLHLCKGHNLLYHLRLQYRFQLLGDGLFASRLSQALFDSDQSSGEGRRKERAATGLRLQSRDTGPPASSELRLVLIGLLSESFKLDSLSSSRMAAAPSIVYEAMSDVISFAIRDLADIELEQCRDSDSIHALDFLRLQYKPPSTVLEAVITPASLRKYDRIFKHLLRMLRVKNVAQGLIRDVTNRHYRSRGRRNDIKFRVEINHFISTLADHAENTVIGSEWAQLERQLHVIEIFLDQSNYEGVMKSTRGLQDLHRLHEESLDNMTRALCLDRKQAQVREVLEDVFGLILRFAATVRKTDMTNVDEGTIKTMHSDFRKHLSRFVRYLRAQADTDSGSRNSSPFEQLLVRLNLFGYYG